MTFFAEAGADFLFTIRTAHFVVHFHLHFHLIFISFGISHPLDTTIGRLCQRPLADDADILSRIFQHQMWNERTVCETERVSAWERERESGQERERTLVSGKASMKEWALFWSSGRNGRERAQILPWKRWNVCRWRKMANYSSCFCYEIYQHTHTHTRLSLLC